MQLRSRSASLIAQQFDTDEAYAIAIEAIRRVNGIELYRQQKLAGIAMGEGNLIEMGTGEGKTLAAVLPVYIQALAGKGAHVWTCSDYLARRDAETLAPIYQLLGLTVGVVQEEMAPQEKRAAYGADITFVTAQEAGFDYLRDAMAMSTVEVMQRPFHYALVDEVDAILLDEAASALVLLSPLEAAKQESFWPELPRIISRLRVNEHYLVDAREQKCYLTDAGVLALETGLGSANLFDQANETRFSAIMYALQAQVLLERDVHYVVRDGKVVAVSSSTGRPSPLIKWPYPLQAAVERKEGAALSPWGEWLGMITLRDLLSLYPAISGMTATAFTAAAEFREWYGLNVIALPPVQPSRRIDLPVQLFRDQSSKEQALADEVVAAHLRGRPVLIGTGSIKEAKRLGWLLREKDIECSVLTGVVEQEESTVMSRAGETGAITISTNMAGRGVDIRINKNASAERANERADTKCAHEEEGLLVIGTRLRESSRMDDQLRGRAGRQGEPGSSIIYASLEDELFVRYGQSDRLMLAAQSDKLWQKGRQIAHMQRVAYGSHAAIRATLFRFSELQEQQRRIVRAVRNNVLHEGRAKQVPELSHALEIPDWQAASEIAADDNAGEELKRMLLLEAIDNCWMAHLAFIAERREAILLESMGGLDPLEAFQRQLHERFESFWREVGERAAVSLAASCVAGRDTAKSRELQSSSKLLANAWTMILTGPAVPQKQFFL